MSNPICGNYPCSFLILQEYQVSVVSTLLFSPEFVTQLKLPAKNWRYLPFFSQSIKEYKIAAEKYEALLKKGS